MAVDGRLVADPAARLPGRGAYVHRSPACWDRAVKRRSFARTLRQAVLPPEGPPPFRSLDLEPDADEARA